MTLRSFAQIEPAAHRRGRLPLPALRMAVAANSALLAPGAQRVAWLNQGGQSCALQAPGSLPSKSEDLHGSGLVLIVDDDELLLRLTSKILESHGYRVLTALNGEAGIQAVQQNHAELALVILDLIMPVMGGQEAFAGIKALAPKLPVILMTGYDALECEDKFAPGALAGFIQKPGTVPNLLRTVKSVLQSNGTGRR